MKNSFKIKNILINSRVVLAPMAGVSNTSYRKIIKEMGAGLIYAEMVSANALMYHNEKTLELLAKLKTTKTSSLVLATFKVIPSIYS